MNLLETPSSQFYRSGGGISGLCLAVILSRSQDIDVSLYESSSRFTEIGAVSSRSRCGATIMLTYSTLIGYHDLVEDTEDPASPGIGFGLCSYRTHASGWVKSVQYAQASGTTHSDSGLDIGFKYRRSDAPTEGQNCHVLSGVSFAVRILVDSC